MDLSQLLGLLQAPFQLTWQMAVMMAAGGLLVLKPGESVTLTSRIYHSFWGRTGKVLVGEVSKVNDDKNDNRFLEPLGRFPGIEEDVKPRHLLCSEYPRV